MSTSKAKTRSNNLHAPLSSFIGREHEISEVKQRLSIHRLVTLTGPGGCGKTRLALQSAGNSLAEFEDGVWLTEFAPLAEAAFVPQVLASALGVSEQPGRALIDTLVNHFLHLHALLLFDNCEHLIAACAQLADALLKACPDLLILATSRETLGVPGEAVFVVPPLSLPEPQPRRGPASAQGASPAYDQSEAVRLFVERATIVSPSFQLTAENGMWVAEICRRLDGMPLAIELAAACVRALSIQQIAEHLDDRFDLLTGGSRTAPQRQQTLEAALDWSYVLLSEVEQKVLQRLSVFAGGCTLEATEVVCSGDGVEKSEVLDVLLHLIDKSLVVADRYDDEIRYHLLETIRQYGREKLMEAGEGDAIRDKHLSYYLQWAERARTYLSQMEQAAWLNRFEAEHDNLRAALEWSQVKVNGAEEGLRLTTTIGDFWQVRGYLTEGRRWFSAALAHKGAQQNSVSRAQALRQATMLAFYQSDYAVVRSLAEQNLAISRDLGAAGRAEVADALDMLAEVATETGDYSAAPALYEQALAIFKEVGDLAGIASVLKALGWRAMRTGDYEQAQSRFEEGLVACRQSRDLHQIISALAGLGELAVRRGRYDRAGELLRESLENSRSLGEKWSIAIALGSLGWVALLQGNFKEMRRFLGESLEVRMQTGDRGGIAWCLEKLAEAGNLQSRFRPAAIIFGAASALRASVGSAMDAADRPAYERTISKIRTKLGEAAFAAAWEEGRVLTVEVAVDYALSEPVIPVAQSAQAVKEEFGGLTKREREVAVLIAKGKSNREIARAMTVGVKTIETYVTRMLDKLGFDSRVQIATWTIEKGFGERSQDEQG